MFFHSAGYNPWSRSGQSPDTHDAHTHRSGISGVDNRRVQRDDPTREPIDAALREHWHLRPTAVAALPAGWMSRAWAVRAGADRFVARLVDDIARQPFEAGQAAALHLRENGIVI